MSLRYYRDLLVIGNPVSTRHAPRWTYWQVPEAGRCHFQLPRRFVDLVSCQLPAEPIEVTQPYCPQGYRFPCLVQA